jgi:hypothetical protein
MGRRHLALVALLVLAGASPAFAQRGRVRANPVAQTPYGPVFNPAQSREWQQAGGNPMVYQQMMRQRMQQAQQKAQQQQYQALQKQQAAFNKWYSEQKAKRDKGQPTDPAFDRMFGKTRSEGEDATPAEAAPKKSKAQFRAEMRKKAEAQKSGLGEATKGAKVETSPGTDTPRG